jgi:hypothetical protein
VAPEVVERPVASANGKAVSNRARHEVHRERDGVRERVPEGKVRRQRRSERAAGAVRMPRLLAWMTELVKVAAVVQQVHDIGILEVAAFHDRRPRTEIDQRLRCLPRIIT